MPSPERPTPQSGNPSESSIGQAPEHFLAHPAAAYLAPVLGELAALRARQAASDEVPAGLQAALAGRYEVERALGAGGMAVVYLARDLRHGRHVALKVVRPGLASAHIARRFAREVETAARLTHPHIVALYDSGEAAGLPFYVMACVEGESLRSRIRRDGPLPVPDAIRIAREVAEALDYAHLQGVVHRDVKPENILMQYGHALVADFGIAHLMRRLQDGDETATADESLTATGDVVGTFAYMSPEQGSSAPGIDGRSDVYGLGCVLFEMLTGRPPFVGSRLDVLQQHLGATPPALPALRPEVPAGLATAVERALAKHPAERFATAAEFATALEMGDRRTGRPIARRVLGAAAVVTLALAVGVVPLVVGLRRGALLDTGARIIVADFKGPASDTSLGAVVTQALQTDLGQSPRVHVATRDEVRATLARMRRADAPRLDLALAREVAQRNGIVAIIDGEVRAFGTRYVLAARVVTADSGKVLVEVKETADDEEALISAIDRLSGKVRERIGEPLKQVRASPPLEQVTTPSLEAHRKYTEAVRVSARVGDERRAAMLLEQAIALDTGFAMAYMALSVIVANQAERRSRRIELQTMAYELRHRLTERERLWLIGDYHGHLGVNFVPAKSLAAYEELATIEVGRAQADALNSAALIYEQLGEFARAASYLSRAIATDSTAAYPYSNLVRVQLTLGRPLHARATVEGMGRWASSHPRFFEARSWIAFAEGRYDSVRVVMRQLRDARRADPAVRATVATQLFATALTRGQLQEAARWAQDAAAAEQERGNAAAVLRWHIVQAEMLIEFRGVTARVVDSLDAAFARAAPTAFSASDDTPAPELLLARAHAGLGRRARMRELVDQWQDRRALRQRALPADGRADRFLHVTLGGIALAESRAMDALVEYRAASRARYCVICAFSGLGQSFDMLAMPDSARVAYEAYVNTPFGRRDRFDPWRLPRALRRLGELYEDRDPARAAQYYGRFINLWKDADPELQPQVREVRERLARLQSAIR